MRVTFDSSVFVSALNFGGVPGDLLKLAALDVFKLQLSPLILEETLRILRDEFAWPVSSLQEVRLTLVSISQRVTPHLQLNISKRDPKDNFIIECSQASGSDYLVTGDKDLLILGQYAGARVLTPTDFLRILRRQVD